MGTARAPVVGVVTFPGTNCDRDTLRALRRAGAEAVSLWHEVDDLSGIEAVVLPGGFSYGDYLRSGAIARFSPIMRAVQARAQEGMPVLGICNGFQILLEAGMLPGAMRRNRDLRFICRTVTVRVENVRTPFTWRYRPGEVLRLPIAHYEGNFFAWPEEMARLEAEGRIVLRYCGPRGEDARQHPGFNPNGSAGAAAAVINETGTVLGMMPHPERASELLLGSEDGLRLLSSLVGWLRGEADAVGAAGLASRAGAGAGAGRVWGGRG